MWETLLHTARGSTANFEMQLDVLPKLLLLLQVGNKADTVSAACAQYS